MGQAVSAYYNELDPEKAEWIRELIKAGVVAPGDVDERSISDVRPGDLRGYRQCHFFAGIGVWSYSLRLAGWPDDREVWTGSCPCPSFSCAGKGQGFDDPRHLWPEWFRLIRESRPAIAIGEQVDSAIGHGWLDLVGMDLEGEAYSLASAVLPAASVGAPHKRNRLYFVAERADLYGERCNRKPVRILERGSRKAGAQVAGSGDAGECTDTDGRQPGNRDLQRSRKQRLLAEDRGTSLSSESARGRRPSGRTGLPLSGEETCGEIERPGIVDGRDSATGDSSDSRGEGLQVGQCDGRIPRQAMGALAGEAIERPSDTLRAYANRIGATRGFWANCDWWYGRDGRYRPIKPGIQPLAHGVAGRVLLLRGAGDAICPPLAAEFIKAYLEASDLTLGESGEAGLGNSDTRAL